MPLPWGEEADREQTREYLHITQPGCCLLGQRWLCIAGTQLSGTHCLGTQPGEPCLAEMDAPSSSAAVFFPCACLAEQSHLAEGEQGDVRNQALSSCSSRPTSGSLMLPWQTALATWLLEPYFWSQALLREVWYPGHWGGPCPGSLGLRMTQPPCC